MSKKVLIIEGEPWLGEQFERTLKRAEFSVTVTSNAYSAMDMVDELHPDVIVMGLLLSGVGGLSLLHELQSYVDTAGVPVIVCVGGQTNITLEDLVPYGVKRVIDTTTMRPDDIALAARSVLAI